MEENNNNDLNEFEKKLKKAIVRDERANNLYIREFLERIKSESNFRELERQRKLKNFYLNTTIFISIIVLITLGFSEIIRYCNKTNNTNSEQKQTLSSYLSSPKSHKNLYILGIEPISHFKLLDTIQSFLDTNFSYNLKFYNGINPISIELNKLVQKDIYKKTLNIRDFGMVIKSLINSIPEDTLGYDKIFILGKIPNIEKQFRKRGLVTNKEDFEKMAEVNSYTFLHIIPFDRNNTENDFATSNAFNDFISDSLSLYLNKKNLNKIEIKQIILK